MLDLNELEQLIAFADTGTLSKVAEAFHISTPISHPFYEKHRRRNLVFSCFTGPKNRIELNETGKVAVECARKLLEEADHAVQRVRTYDAELKTITVKSCAPAPLWKLLMQLNSQYPEMTISSGICQNAEVLEALHHHKCELAILPFLIHDKTLLFQKELYEGKTICLCPEES